MFGIVMVHIRGNAACRGGFGGTAATLGQHTAGHRPFLGGIILLILTILWNLCGWVVGGTVYAMVWYETSFSFFLLRGVHTCLLQGAHRPLPFKVKDGRIGPGIRRGLADTKPVFPTFKVIQGRNLYLERFKPRYLILHESLPRTGLPHIWQALWDPSPWLQHCAEKVG